ncbi:MAG TPA: MYXO-CTERM sorting domain-containing protein, partial [Kofleriaceae bacterium]
DYTPYCNGNQACIPAKGGENLDTLADRAMNRFVYRRFADHEAMLLGHSVQVGTTSTPPGGVRWYELRDATTPTLFQSGTFQPDTTIRWMPSIAMDASGEIALAYTQSSAAMFPSIKYTARAPSDPAGTMGYGEGTLQAGTGSQQGGGNRWGDYASLNIDPSDDCTFWLTHEYYASTTANNVWSTRVGSFLLPGCSAFAVTQPDPESVPQGGSMTYTITTATTAGAAQSVALTTTGLPAGVTATLAPASVQSGNTTQITLTADATAALGTTNYQLVGTGAAAMSTATVALTVTAPVVPPDAAGGGGSQGGGCCGVSGGSSPIEPTILVLGVGFVIARRRRRRG